MAGARGVLMLSVVVCTYNPRREYLERCLDAILGQSVGSDHYELILIDNRSAEPLADRDWIRQRGVRVVREEIPGLTAARERAAEVARGEVIIFVDDDNVIERGYLAAAEDLFRNERIGVLSGQVEPEYERRPGAWFAPFEETLAVRRFPADLFHLTSDPEFTRYFPIGAGVCIRQSLLREYFQGLSSAGRIEGRTGAVLSAGEDIDIDLFAVSRGYLVGACSRLRLTHLIPASRINVGYVTRLCVGSLRSAAQVNMKWRAVFGRNVLPYFGQGALAVLLKALLYTCLSPLKRYRVLARFHWELFRLLPFPGGLGR